jgi:uncharacterized protein YkwD
MWRPSPRLPTSGRAYLVAALLAIVVTTGLLPIRPASPVAAGTAETMEAKLLAWVNNARKDSGLVPLRLHAGLAGLAGDRAATLASKDLLSHSAAGCLSCQLGSRNIQWYGFGEAIGWTTYPWGDQAAASLFSAWRNSPGHWALLMSAKYNYVGIGVAYRSSGRKTYGSIVLTESIDQTRPWAKMLSGYVNGDDVTWTWTGDDTPLQTHTAGFKDFDLQLRIDNGGWAPMANATKGKILTLRDRAHGHWYGLRVIARDKRGLVSFWTPEVRVWVP